VQVKIDTNAVLASPFDGLEEVPDNHSLSPVRENDSMLLTSSKLPRGRAHRARFRQPNKEWQYEPSSNLRLQSEQSPPRSTVGGI
jgi:hypothetical protein